MVEGTSVFRMTPPFAGLRRKEGLGRSDASREVSSSFVVRAGDSGCPLVAEEGNVVGMRTKKAHAPPEKASRLLERDASFARSRDPCTSIATTLRRRKPTKVAREVGYRGRVNLRKQEEPAPGSHRPDVARLAA
jgi:hypothetical protein